MKKHSYSLNKFIFRENNALVINEEFTGKIKIEGYTENGKYEFEGMENDKTECKGE